MPLLRIDVVDVAPMLGGVEGFTKADLKSILAGFDPGIKHLIEAGYIMASKSRNPRIRKVACVVEPIYLDQFLEKYVPAKELAVRFDLKSPTIIAKLKNLRVERLAMPRGGIGSI